MEFLKQRQFNLKGSHSRAGSRPKLHLCHKYSYSHCTQSAGSEFYKNWNLKTFMLKNIKRHLLSLMVQYSTGRLSDIFLTKTNTKPNRSFIFRSTEVAFDGSFHLFLFPQNGALIKKKSVRYLVLWQFCVYIMPTIPNFYCI